MDDRYDSYSVTPPAGFGGQGTWTRLAETKWGNENPAVCGGGSFTEQYTYDAHGRQSGKALRFRRNDPNRPQYPNKGEAVLTGRWTWQNGRIATISYPWTETGSALTTTTPVQGQDVQHTFDTMLRPNGLNARPTSMDPYLAVVTSVAYATGQGAMTQIQYGGTTETRGYNVLGQLTGISYNGVLRHEYRYSATNSTGRVASEKNHLSGEDILYEYNILGQLAKAETVGPEWGQAFSYDGFGNLVGKSVTKGSAPALNVTADPATNRLVASGLSYDANGNMVNIPNVGAVSYDGRNRMRGVGVLDGQPATRGYDASNRKVWVADPQDSKEIAVDFFLPTGEKIGTYKTFLHSGHGQTPQSGAEQCDIGSNGHYCISFRKDTEYTYFAGRLVKTQTSVTAWNWPDRLSSEGGKHPYGEGTPKFATYWPDGGLHYAMNRYYSSTYGRFTTSDPYRASGGPADPTSWNRYVYTRGNPVNRIDSLGLQDQEPGSGELQWCASQGKAMPPNLCVMYDQVPDGSRPVKYCMDGSVLYNGEECPVDLVPLIAKYFECKEDAVAERERRLASAPTPLNPIRIMSDYTRDSIPQVLVAGLLAGPTGAVIAYGKILWEAFRESYIQATNWEKEHAPWTLESVIAFRRDVLTLYEQAIKDCYTKYPYQ